MINRRGQNVGMGQLLLILIGIIGLILVALFLYNSWNQISDVSDAITPEQRVYFKQTCEQSIKTGTLFCDDFNELEVGNEVQLMNCKHLNGALGLGIDSSDISCTGANVSYCTYLKTTLTEDEYKKQIVNGDLCTDILGASSSVPASGGNSNILQHIGDGSFEIISYEECVSGLEQRKTDLEIPDKLCYWEAMAEIYDEKCENLERDDISDIFEKKAEYRRLNNPNWPSLNVDGDFCVDVIYDCDRGLWASDLSKEQTNAYVLLNDTDKSIHINPYKLFDKEKIEILLFHEGLHSIQLENENYGNLLEDLFLQNSYIDRLIEIYPELNGTYKKREFYVENIEDLFELEMDRELEKLEVFSGEENYISEYNALRKDYSQSSKYLIEISSSTKPVNVNDFVNESNRFYSFFDSNVSYRSTIADLNLFLETDFSYLLDLVKAFWYTSQISELDPRLSEVHRWWFDNGIKENGTCEVLYTPEQFELILDKFLDETNVDSQYVATKKEINDVLTVAEKLGRREEIWNELIGRGPGLVSNTPDYLDPNQQLVA